MSEDRCIHDMLPGQCSICQKLPDDELFAAAAMGERGHRPIAQSERWHRPDEDWRGYCTPGCPDDVCRSMRQCAWPKR